MVNKTSKSHKVVKSSKTSKVMPVGSKKNSKGFIPKKRIPDPDNKE